MTTIRDVAAHAGVAPSTVSYVLSGSRRVSEPTRRAVRAAIDALGYHPRASARSLRSARSEVLALAVPRAPGAHQGTDGRFAIDISDAAREHGYDLLLVTDRDGVGALRRVARSRLADAAVLMAVEQRDPRIAAVRHLGFPTVLLGYGDDTSLPWVDLDWEAAVALAVRRTAAAGHHHIAFLSSAEDELAARRGYAVHGLRGARSAAREVTARVRVRPSAADPTELAARLHDLLTTPPLPTALIVQHLTHLPTLLETVAATGRRVPADLAVVLVGSLPRDPVSSALPRVELPVTRMSAAVTRLAVDVLRDGTAPTGAPDAPATTTAHARYELIPPLLAPEPGIPAPALRPARPDT